MKQKAASSTKVKEMKSTTEQPQTPLLPSPFRVQTGQELTFIFSTLLVPLRYPNHKYLTSHHPPSSFTNSTNPHFPTRAVARYQVPQALLLLAGGWSIFRGRRPGPRWRQSLLIWTVLWHEIWSLQVSDMEYRQVDDVKKILMKGIRLWGWDWVTCASDFKISHSLPLSADYGSLSGS